MISEAQLALLFAARDWDPSRGVPFRAYALTRMRWRVTAMLRLRGYNARLVSRDVSAPPLESLSGLAEKVADPRSEQEFEQAETHVDLERLLKHLTPRQAAELRLYASGVSLAELGPSEPAAHHRLRRARERALRAYRAAA